MGNQFVKLLGWESSENQWEHIHIDPSTHTLQTIEYEHHEIHGGNGYTIATFSDIDDSNSYDIGITTPNSTSSRSTALKTSSRLSQGLSWIEEPKNWKDASSL